jgi:hypothetical protein
MTPPIMRKIRMLATCLALTPLLAAAADEAPRLICATQEAMDCEPGAPCFKGRPSEIGAPTFMRVDLEKKVIAGPKRSTPILSMEKTADGFLLQGTEIGFGWTMVIDMIEGTMAATLVNKDGAFVLFGSCTPL